MSTAVSPYIDSAGELKFKLTCVASASSILGAPAMNVRRANPLVRIERAANNRKRDIRDDFREDDGIFYIAMEFAEGQELQEFFDNNEWGFQK